MYFLVFGLFRSTSSWTFFRVSTSCRGLSFFIHGSILFHECDVIYLPTVVLIDIELIPVGSYYKESYCEHFFPCVILDTGWHFSRIYSLMSSGSRTRQMSSFRTYGKHFKVLKQFILPPKYMVGIVVPLSHEHLEYSGLFKNSGRYILVIHCDFNFYFPHNWKCWVPFFIFIDHMDILFCEEFVHAFCPSNKISEWKSFFLLM